MEYTEFMEKVALREMIEVEVMEESSDTLDISHIYTPLSVAKEEIRRRWADKDLRKKVEEFFGVVPEAFQDGLNAALFRFVATPNLECALAQDMASLADLNFVFMEFLNDKFCTRNADKVHLGRMSFFDDKNNRQAETGSRKKVIDLVQSEGVRFKDMKTLDGGSFVDFHHNLFQMKGDDLRTFDVSHFKTNGETALEVYMKVFSLFVCHGILFENYFLDIDPDERRFTKEVIVPVFEIVHKKFGVKPLIVPIVTNKDENTFWQYYPQGPSL